MDIGRLTFVNNELTSSSGFVLSYTWINPLIFAILLFVDYMAVAMTFFLDWRIGK